MTKKSTEKLVSNLLEIQREVVEIFDSMTEDECVENFDLEDFLYSIEEKVKELKKIKNFKIVEL